MNFFRCKMCGYTQTEVHITDEALGDLLSCCPMCGVDHFAEGYAQEAEAEIENPYRNGDAVIAHDGDLEITGVVSEVYEDVVYVDYFDTSSMSMEQMEFHIDNVEAYG